MNKLIDKCKNCTVLQFKIDALSIELDVVKTAVRMAVEELVTHQKIGIIGKEKQDWIRAVLVDLLQDAKNKVNAAASQKGTQIVQ